VPYWLKVVRSGGSFTGYISSDGCELGAAGIERHDQHGSDVYVGLGVCNLSTTSLATATFEQRFVWFDHCTGAVNHECLCYDGSCGESGDKSAGANFGATQGSSVVLLNGAPVTVNLMGQHIDHDHHTGGGDVRDTWRCWWHQAWMPAIR